MNVGGLLALAAGALLLVIGLRGTQHQVAPGLFGVPPANAQLYTPAATPTQQPVAL